MGTVTGLSPTRYWRSYCDYAVLVVPVVVLVQLCGAFNLDADTRVVFTGPPGSYFGYSVEFFDNSSSISVLIGAPKANTSQPNITEGGGVYLCPWSHTNCNIINFDKQGDRYFDINDVNTQVEFKSHQWFGATVRSHGNSACAPRYYWRTKHDTPFADVTGTCYLSVDSLKTFVEYAPCRTGEMHPNYRCVCVLQDGRVVLGGPGSFYWQGQLITATTEEIVKAYYPSYFLLSVARQIQTHQVQGTYDDSYLGEEGQSNNTFIALAQRNISKQQNAMKGDIMGSYFGYAVAAIDINNDGLDDLVVGAPMFMHQGSCGRMEELGKVYVYLQRGRLLLEPSQSHLLGTQAFSRFGSSLAPLGDLNQDGFNDLAVGCPYGGVDQQGLVLIYKGDAGGMMDTPTQTLSGQWASSSFPANFGFALKGNRDLDQNGYPDLIVGAFGADKAVLYRARPIVRASASLTVHPTIFNQDEKTCELDTGSRNVAVSCVSITFCLLAKGKHLPSHLGEARVQLDSVKQSQEESIRRTLFLDSKQPSLLKTFSLANGERLCHDTKAYLRGEDEFRDKLSPIYISLNFSLDPQAPVDQHGLRSILDYQTEQLIEQKAQIQLDCGEDNICVPDLKLAVYGDRTEVYLGDENSLSLTFNARNEGEGGAYEAELYVILPPEADYSGIGRNNVVRKITRLLHYYYIAILMIVAPASVSHKLCVCVFCSVSRPDKVIFPPPNWTVHQSLSEEQDIGPELQQVYELVNNGPSAISHTTLEVRCPLKALSHELLYPVEVVTEGPLTCFSKTTFNALKLKVRTHNQTCGPAKLKSNSEHSVQRREVYRDPLVEQGNLTCSTVECWKLQCNVGLLVRGSSVILTVRSRLWAETFMEVRP
uniref:Integrin alpha-2 domain-containing protein n=1 Tax=Anabas testudineus TaxID=64144 RepID=A0A7N6F6I8_ANATE